MTAPFISAAMGRSRPSVDVARSSRRARRMFVMNCTDAPYSDNNVRMALKYAIDREQLLKTVLRGYGRRHDDICLDEVERIRV
jgi:peptide/nickel transport system substrate-binding protein